MSNRLLKRRAVAALLLLGGVGIGCANSPSEPTPPTLEPVTITAISPSQGRAGDTVNVMGTGFQPGARVTFGGVVASVIALTSTRVTATVPTHPPGIVDIAVTNPNGERATLAGGYTLQVPPDTLGVLLTVSPSVVSPGGQVTVSWEAAGRRSSLDWIGLFKTEAPNSSYSEGSWWYTNGGSGTQPFKAPAEPGEYEFRYLPDDGYIDVARSPLTVR